MRPLLALSIFLNSLMYSSRSGEGGSFAFSTPAWQLATARAMAIVVARNFMVSTDGVCRGSPRGGCGFHVANPVHAEPAPEAGWRNAATLSSAPANRRTRDNLIVSLPTPSRWLAIDRPSEEAPGHAPTLRPGFPSL